MALAGDISQETISLPPKAMAPQGDQDFDQVATSAANAPVEPEPGQRKKRRGLFR